MTLQRATTTITLGPPLPLTVETFAERVKRLRKEKSWTQVELKKRSGLSQTTISDIERGRNKSAREIVRLADTLGVTVEYLRTGRVSPIARQTVARYAEHNSRFETVQVPVFSANGSMGRGAMQSEHDIVVDYMPLARRWINNHLPDISSALNLTCISARGDSMSPTFNDGDILIVDTGVRELKLDAVYVLAKEQELFIKRVQRRLDGSIVIKSDNEVYDAQTIERPEAAGLSVLGRVVWAWNGRRM